jgi:hypothetical protein
LLGREEVGSFERYVFTQAVEQAALETGLSTECIAFEGG